MKMRPDIIVKAIIGAVVPTVLGEVFRRTRPVSVPIERMVDSTDWDREYEELLNETEKKSAKRARK